MSDPSPEPAITMQMAIVVLLILIEALFSSADIAFASLNRNRMKELAEDGSRKAELLSGVAEEPNKFLSAIRVIIALLGLFAGAFSALSFAAPLSRLFADQGLADPYADIIAFLAAVLLPAFFFLVLGIMFPRRLALCDPEKAAMFLARPVLLIIKLLTPLLALLSVCVRGLMRLSGKDAAGGGEEYSEEEIKFMLEAGQESGQLNEAGREMIYSVFEFDDKLAYEIMTPRTDVYSIDINEDLREYLDELLEERYSRVPVYDKDSDDIIGILYMKDFFLQARKVGFENVEIRPLLQKPFFVPESKKINDLFSSLQLSKMHIAILIDEYGGFSGIVTMEDIIEEIMGDIDDEYDDDEPKLEQLDDTTWLVDGQYYLDDLSEELDYPFESENHETIGGLVIDLIGEIPDEDEKKYPTVEYEGCTFKVEAVKDRRIDKVRITVPKPACEETEETDSEPVSDER